MGILILLQPPIGFDRIKNSFRTEKHAEVKATWQAKGETADRFAGAKIGFRVRGILEAFQELHCTVKDLHIGVNRHMIVPNGAIHAWTEESEQLAKEAIAEAMQLFEELQQLPLRDFEFYVEFNLEQDIKSTATEPWRSPIMGQPNDAGRGWD